ncbi:MAG TPA: hypothetical protein VFG71_10355 [Nitrospiraceae bacterium]|nr:hypothetical protein [Nitrospiraceae bacterium]
MKYQKIAEGNREAMLVQSHMVYENQFTECLNERRKPFLCGIIEPMCQTGHARYEEWR